jgi:hypothetical protein
MYTISCNHLNIHLSTAICTRDKNAKGETSNFKPMVVSTPHHKKNFLLTKTNFWLLRLNFFPSHFTIIVSLFATLFSINYAHNYHSDSHSTCLTTAQFNLQHSNFLSIWFFCTILVLTLNRFPIAFITEDEEVPLNFFCFQLFSLVQFFSVRSLFKVKQNSTRLTTTKLNVLWAVRLSLQG